MGSITAPSYQIQLSRENLGVYHVDKISQDSIDEATRLLQKNHDEIHMFWRDANGHNHTAHNVLTSLALGATPAELRQAFDDDRRDQARSKPDPDPEMVKALHDPEFFLSTLGNGKQYPNHLEFFKQEIEKKGWRAVVNEYVFSRTPLAEALLAKLFEGAYHPIIHVGLGIEFQEPGIIAEGLSEAAGDGAQGFEGFLRASDALESTKTQPLVELLEEVYNNDKVSNAAKWEDGPNKIRAGVLGRAGDEVAHIAAKYQVRPEDLERRTAEMVSSVAYMATAGQRAGKLRKIDFFWMHNVTGSIFLRVFANQDWIKLEDRARLLQCKGRTDLVWYAACGAAKLDISNVANYHDSRSANMGWQELFLAINEMHDDGHVAKFARALKSGEETAAAFESSHSAEFPVKGDLWLQAARMSYDTNLGLEESKKWLFFAGFDQAWAAVESTSNGSA